MRAPKSNPQQLRDILLVAADRAAEIGEYETEADIRSILLHMGVTKGLQEKAQAAASIAYHADDFDLDDWWGLIVSMCEHEWRTQVERTAQGLVDDDLAGDVDAIEGRIDSHPFVTHYHAMMQAIIGNPDGIHMENDTDPDATLDVITPPLIFRRMLDDVHDAINEIEDQEEEDEDDDE